jgi:hypothetical protein
MGLLRLEPRSALGLFLPARVDQVRMRFDTTIVHSGQPSPGDLQHPLIAGER